MASLGVQSVGPPPGKQPMVGPPMSAPWPSLGPGPLQPSQQGLSLPQRMLDSAPEDGPPSVAYNLQAEIQHVGQMRPCPNTKQYIHRGLSRQQEAKMMQPNHSCDICGWVFATVDASDTEGHAKEDILHLRLDEFRAVFQCISGWTLMIWRSQDDFEDGIYGARRAPRPLAWWDLRKAWDVHVEVGDAQADLVPNRITVMTSTGNLYFCVELTENVPVWFFAIRTLIKENYVHQVAMKDSVPHQRKRWPAACGLARALVSGQPIGDRALAIAFHLYDIDYDSVLQAGELMVLVKELFAGLLSVEGRAEGQDRATGIISVEHRVPEDDLFERATRFRRRCDATGDGRVRKDDFLRCGHIAMLEALDLPGSMAVATSGPPTASSDPAAEAFSLPTFFLPVRPPKHIKRSEAAGCWQPASRTTGAAGE
eukprot:CAMPEP_0197902766 /NCGR_PEP_ID=MMETSP1439-20131203/54250_1 /TAXON_ID=66791 /ORGANISM="Gonyaulax spinifera, Strain CCMP409" /LENGTH=424 /DNA_ID=CAMNT_0043523821 /DNA_START=21 /DNA_END=1296 /DNA_ORIENTATION=+